jgi:ubiquinone biosynthesis protein UbiJ
MAALPEIVAASLANHLLAQAGWARDRLARFQGRGFSFSCGGQHVSLRVVERGMLKSASADEVVEVHVELPPDTPLRLLRGRSEVMAATRISGPADFADALGFVLRNLEWDAEGDMARLVGDIAAHRLVGVLRAAADWQRQASENLLRNLGEYAVYEAGWLPQASQVKSFRSDVESLEHDIEALEKRALRLSQGSAQRR